MQYLEAISKIAEISVHFQGKPFNITVIQVYAQTSDASEAEVERPARPFRTITQKRCPFHYRGLECTSKKSRDTCSNRQMWPGSTKWSRAKAKTQKKTLHMDITRWSVLKSDWLYSLQPKMEKFYTVSKNKTRSYLWLRTWSPYCQIQT